MRSSPPPSFSPLSLGSPALGSTPAPSGSGSPSPSPSLSRPGSSYFAHAHVSNGYPFPPSSPSPRTPLPPYSRMHRSTSSIASLSSVADAGYELLVDKFAPAHGAHTRRSRFRWPFAAALAFVALVGFAAVGRSTNVVGKLREQREKALVHVNFDETEGRVGEWRDWWAGYGGPREDEKAEATAEHGEE